MTREDFEKINIAADTSLEILKSSIITLLETVDTLTYERDVYKAKYEQECELRKIISDARDNNS